MPLGNLTSQFFANVYLNELDYFVKHKLKAKYYIRYVDDFVILNKSKEHLEKLKSDIDYFLKKNLELELHKDKSKVYNLSNVIDFVGFRVFYNFKIPRKRNIRKMKQIILKYKKNKISFSELFESFKGWRAYTKWLSSHTIQESLKKEIISILINKI